MSEAASVERPVESPPIKAEAIDLDFYYGANQALHGISLPIPERQVTALIGPSGCGKSTFLRCLNRMNDLIEGTRVEGTMRIDGEDVNAPSVDVVELRRRVGMVFQQSNPFPKSIFENVAYGPRIHGLRDREQIAELVRSSLEGAGLWSEVSDRLQASALALSGGQQQRLCIARARPDEPEGLLMDEPARPHAPRSTARIEDLIAELRENYTIVIVTHNMQQAARVSDQTAFFYEGRLIEYGPTKRIFTNPTVARTQDYITGRFG